MVEIYAELEPSRDRNVIINRARLLAEFYGRVDVPDIPLGKPSIFSPLMALFIRHSLGSDVIAHLRVVDHNILSIKSIIKTLIYVNIRKLILLRGDPPRQGDPCSNTWNPENAVIYAKKYGAETGLLISPRKDIREIMQRIEVGADYYYITRINEENKEKIKIIIDKIINNDSRPGLYIVIGSPNNIDYLNKYKISYINYKKIRSMVEWAEKNNVERIILSSPGDGDLLTRREIVGELASWIGI